jgi:hypothetical protein
MWLDELRLWIRNYPRNVKPAARRRKMKRRLYVEALENRLCLSSFNAATTAALIAAIHSANTNGAAANTINLTGNGPYSLTAMDNNTNGPNGLPVIGSTVASTLTINGNGDIIENDSGSPLRFFEIAPGSGGSLVLKNIELQGGLAEGSGTSAEGGAIFNNGTLNVDGGVQLFDNKAIATGFTSGGGSNNAAGGGIYSTAGGTLKFNGNNLIEACYVIGGFANFGTGAVGGSARGGGVFANTTTATSLSSTTGTVIEGCQVFGGTGGAGGFGLTGGTGGVGGSGLGGGLFVSGSSSAAKATLTGFKFDNDEAFGGTGGAGGFGKQGGTGGAGGEAGGGGIYASGGTVTDSNFIDVLDCEAVGGAGGRGGDGNFTGGGNGGNGGSAVGGGVDAFATTLTLSASPTIENNLAIGGGGGNGGNASSKATTGGNGGNSGTGYGGGLYANGSVPVTLKNALVSNNTAEENRPGNGGLGFVALSGAGFGGAGGSYTGGFGGGIYLDQNASLASDTINLNTACGGLIVPAARLTLSPAGTGMAGGAGGNGATGAGGGLFVAGGTITVTSCTFDFNKASGGAAGNALIDRRGAIIGAAGTGGVGRGGALDVESGTITISKSQIENNFALGADQALTRGGQFAPGGAAAGGGLYAGGGTIQLTRDFIQRNQADGDYNPLVGGLGTGYGGGIYEVTGTTLTQDSFTSANLANNTASNNASSDNFGSGGPMG